MIIHEKGQSNNQQEHLRHCLLQSRSFAKGPAHFVLKKKHIVQNGIRMASEWRQKGIRMASEMMSEWDRNGIGMASERWQNDEKETRHKDNEDRKDETMSSRWLRSEHRWPRITDCSSTIDSSSERRLVECEHQCSYSYGSNIIAISALTSTSTSTFIFISISIFI